MGASEEQKLVERNIPGANRRAHFVEVEHAEHAGETLKRIGTYFSYEKTMLIGMLGIVAFGTLCGVYAPSVQSRAIDIIAGTKEGKLLHILIMMLSAYLLYSCSQLLQNLLSAKLSQRVDGGIFALIAGYRPGHVLIGNFRALQGDGGA